MSPRAVEPLAPADLEAVLALNRGDEHQTSVLDRAGLEALVASAWRALVVRENGAACAFLVGFDERSSYSSPNYLWFRARHPRFAYVDRVVTAAHARGRGHARALYEAVFAHAAAEGRALVGCEVNSDPPNPASDAFHAALGFREVGHARVGAKSVRYLERAP